MKPNHLIRSAVRQWMRSPLVAAISIVSLGFGIGAGVAVFALVDALHSKPLPVTSAGNLAEVGFGSRDGPGEGHFSYFGVRLWDAFRDTQPVFEAVAAAAPPQLVKVSRGGSTWSGQALYVSGSFFQLLGVPMMSGRPLLPTDDVTGAPPVAVIDYPFWRRELGGREPIVGTHVTVNGVPVEIVGVTARPFFGIIVGSRMQVYLSLAPALASVTARRGDVQLDEVLILGRRRAGQSLDQAAGSLRSWQPAWRRAVAPFGEEARESLAKPLTVISIANGMSSLRKTTAEPLSLLMLAVGLVLAIACTNVAALLSARFADRAVDLWTRRALGASTGQLLVGMLAEALLVTSAGAALGVSLAVWLARVLMPVFTPRPTALQPADSYLAIALDWRLAALGVVLAVVTGVAAGLPPALSATRTTRLPRAGGPGHAGTGSAGLRRVMLTLIAGQIALVLILVSCACGLVRSFLALTMQPTGVDVDHVMLASLDGPIFDAEPSVAARRVQDLCDTLARIAGVQAVAASTVTPMSGLIMLARLHVPGYVSDRSIETTAINRVTPGFFATFGTPVLEGRGFGSRDARDQPGVAIVNRAFERRYFEGRSAVGQIIHVGGRTAKLQPLQIVGVAATAKYMELRDDERPVVYRPLAQSMPSGDQPLRLAFRSAVPDTLRSPILAELQRFDPRLTVEFRTLYDEVASSVGRKRTLAWSGGLVSLLALALAALGLYGSFSHMVVRRRAEIAIRLALGARQRSIQWLVARSAALAVIGGCLLGGAGLGASARFVQSMVYGVHVLEPWAIVGTVLVVIAVAAGATFIPIRRAGRIDPMRTLRAQ